MIASVSASAVALLRRRCGLIDPLLRAVADAGYQTPDADPGAGDPAPAGRPRRARLRADRHRQDGRVRAADPRPPGAHAARGRERGPRVLVLAPTRELARRSRESFRDLRPPLSIKHGRRVRRRRPGAAGQALRRNADVVVATPGPPARPDGAGARSTSTRVEMLVLDEADRMLDMGFIDADPAHHRGAAAQAAEPDVLGDDAAGDPQAGDIASWSIRSKRRGHAGGHAPPRQVEQWVLHVDAADKRALLCEVLRDPAMTRVLVFTRTKHGANRVAEQLDRSGVRADAIHGNKSQDARQRALDAFKRGSIRVLVATDIAARGIDVDGDHPRHQLRAAQRARELRPPHRPHRPRRRRPAWRCHSATPRSATPCAPSSASREPRCGWSRIILMRGSAAANGRARGMTRRREPVGKAEDKRAAIVAAQAAREAAERAARAALGPSAVPARKRRTNWAARRSRPRPRPPEAAGRVSRAAARLPVNLHANATPRSSRTG